MENERPDRHDVPLGWKLLPLKHCLTFAEGPGILAADFVGEGVSLLRIAGLGNRKATLEGCDYLAPDLVDRKWEHLRVRCGDLLISGSASSGFCCEGDENTAGDPNRELRDDADRDPSREGTEVGKARRRAVVVSVPAVQDAEQDDDRHRDARG